MSANPNQAFWREVLDQVAPLVFVFRIDADESAHLVYANDPVERWLGFAPADFVGLAEQPGEVAAALTAFVDEMAGKSHEPTERHVGRVDLPDRSGRRVPFSYRFRLHQSASVKAWVMTVTLEPETGAVASDAGFVTASPFLTTLTARLQVLAKAGVPVWFQGEPGTGRKTLARWYASVADGRPWVADAERLSAKKWETVRGEVVAVVSAESPETVLRARKWDPVGFHARGFQVVPVPDLTVRREDAEAYARRLARAVDADAEAVVAGLPRVATFPAVREAVFRSLAGGAAGDGPFVVRPYEVVVAEYLDRVLAATGGRIYGRDGAAALLGLKPTTLQSKLKRLSVR